MGFLKNKVLGKKNPPEELPELAIDEIKSKIKDSETGQESKKQNISGKKHSEKELYEDEDKKIISSIPEDLEEKQIPEPDKKIQEVSKEHSKQIKQIEKEKLKIDAEKSFFREILSDMESGIENNSDEFEKWYKNKFLSKEIINDMKGYWENQKEGIISTMIGKNFKEKVREKIERLQNLEAEWQKSYFNLLQKENEIKDEEKELKKILSEFIRIVKSNKKESERLFKKSHDEQEIPVEKRFFADGFEPFSNLDDLIRALEKEDKIFYKHCNEEHDNFADWIENVLDFKELAEKLRKIKSKQKYIEEILSEIKR